MKLLKVFSGFLLAVAAFVSVNVSADTPVSCNWQVSQIQYIPYSNDKVTIVQCLDGSTVAATLASGNGSHSNICTLNAAPGYSVAGDCHNPVVAKGTGAAVVEPATCPVAGSVFATNLTVGDSYTFPSSQLNTFCHLDNPACAYKTTTVGSVYHGAIVNITCTNK